MSGGYFDYQQYRLSEMADTIDTVIKNNHKKDEYNCSYDFSEETLEKFKEAALTARIAGAMLQRVDWLLMGDDGEKEFRRRWEIELKKVKDEYGGEGR